MSFYNTVRRLWNANALWLAIKGQIGDYISSLGSILKSETLVYNKWTYAGFQRAALEIAPTLVRIILKLFPNLKKVVYFGCGTGVYVVEFRKKDVDAEGYEYYDDVREMAQKLNNLKIYPFDLADKFELNKTFDLSICIEVAEHLVPDMGDRLVDVCCKYSEIIIFSAGHPSQGGQGHINEQPKSYWIKKFAERNYLYDGEKSQKIELFLRENLIRGFWVADNICVFVKEA